MTSPLPAPTGASLPPPAAATAPAGWYPDPLGQPAWRWWDGRAWTPFSSAYTPGPEGRKPRLPRLLSVPVLLCLPLVLVVVAIIAIASPLSVVAGLVPLGIVLPVLGWLDRVEPEPRASRWHAVLWGASVAVVVALIVNTLVAVVAGEVASMVVSAPVVEEAMKALGIVWAVRRREVDGVTDGIVYAGWVALGFAVVEDMTYFVLASSEGSFVPVFVVRALLTPFAHPLFTFWTGLAIGRAVRNGKPLVPSALWGYALAVACHFTWNGSLAIGDVRPDIDEDVALWVVGVTALLFVVLFVTVAITLRVMRRREQRRFERMTPFLVERYGLRPDEAAMFTGWSNLLRVRRSLPRRDRRRFDEVYAALARLWLQHERPHPIDPAVEHVLVAQLTAARTELDRARWASARR